MGMLKWVFGGKMPFLTPTSSGREDMLESESLFSGKWISASISFDKIQAGFFISATL